MDDRWRDTYDAWKTRTPWDDDPACEVCGQNLRRDYCKSPLGGAWYCPDCVDREAEQEAQDDAAYEDFMKEPL